MPVYQKICINCGNTFPARRSDALTCSNTCRSQNQRAAIKRLESAPDQQLILEGAALLQKLKKILPRTAQSIEAFIDENRAAQTGILVRLALTAHFESSEVVKRED